MLNMSFLDLKPMRVALLHQVKVAYKLSVPKRLISLNLVKLKQNHCHVFRKYLGHSYIVTGVTIPHVTQFDEADITNVEAFRKEQNVVCEKQKLGFKITPLVFILKAVADALRAYPTFNSSLSEDGESLILKKYIHIGVAVDTPPMV